MFHPQQTSYTNYYPQTPNPNQDIIILCPPQVLASELPPHPQLHPPGSDPYAPQIPFGFDGQTPHFEEPNAVSQSWVVKQADPITYNTSAINSSNEESAVSTNLNSLWSNYWMNQVMVNGVANTVPKQTKVTQPMRCDICNIVCNSKDVFLKHISGKKHKGKLQTHISSATAILRASGVASGVASGEVLETKRQKLMVGGAAVDSMRFCAICNVACNSQVVFNKHLAGKKHAAAQAGIRPPNGVANPNSILSISPTVQPQANCMLEGGPKPTKVVQFAWCEVCKLCCSNNDILIKHELGKKHQKKLKGLEKSKRETSAPASTEAPVTTNPIIGAMENPVANRGKSSVEPQGNCTLVVPKQIKAAQSARCEVCKIYCNNNDLLMKHQLGKKHQQKLKKLEKSEKNTSTPVSTEAPVTTNPIIGSMENPETHKCISIVLKKRKASRSKAPDEDLETKKRKIMERGAAAAAVRTCSICNVVCNSQAVFNSHLTGTKHAAMLKKQVEAGLTSAAAPQVVATT